MKKLSLVLLLFAFVFSGCSASRVTGSEGKTASTDPKADVIAASRKFAALKSLTGKIEATGPAPFKQTVEYIAPDRYHVSYRDESGANSEMIMAGDKAYVKSGDSWNEMAGNTKPTPTMRNSFTEDVLSTISDVKFEGDAILDGKPVLVYSYKLVTKVGSFAVMQRIWVDKTSGLPIKCYVEYTDGSIKTLTTSFDTDTPVKIELPAK